MPPGCDDDRTLSEIELALPDERKGKVRVSWALSGDRRLFVTTDRLSAFDRILACVPYKGQVLNQLAWWWFDSTRSIVANHALAVPDPNALVATSATILPVEMVVRGHITGVTGTSLWTMYETGERHLYGHHLPDGLNKNEQLPTPIITPTTKAEIGTHDEPLSVHDVVSLGLVQATRWDEVCAAALALFEHGRQVAEKAGLILADTKYEFGLAVDTGEVMLIDEVHTPDSSRFWVADTYQARVAAGDEPESLDKEFVRRALIELGYRGEGPPPALPAEVIEATSARYISAFERITGQPFVRADQPARERIVAAVTRMCDGREPHRDESPDTLVPATDS
jgi:phosphoribosylaminoimidazole-succinocarboxamide synthase